MATDAEQARQKAAAELLAARLRAADDLARSNAALAQLKATLAAAQNGAKK